MADILTFAKSFLVQYGYLPSATADEIASTEDIDFRAAIAKYRRFEFDKIAGKSDAAGHAPPENEGDIDPVLIKTMLAPRCACKDMENGEPIAAAQGRAGWRGCHQIGNFHAAIVQVDGDNVPNFLQPHFREVIANVQQDYARFGLLLRFRNADQNDILTGQRLGDAANIQMSFTRGNGWIGLAIVGNPGIQTCSSSMWAKFDYRYQPSNIAREWRTLLNHEFGHNCGLQHSSGGVMNPSIVPGLNGWSESDPSFQTLKSLFGGEKVQIPGGDTKPPTTGGRMQPASETFKMADGKSYFLVESL